MKKAAKIHMDRFPVMPEAGQCGIVRLQQNS